MSPYATLFAFFGLYFLFMLVFFVLLCLLCLLGLLWYHRKEGLTCDLPEDTPIRAKPHDCPSTSKNSNKNKL